MTAFEIFMVLALKGAVVAVLHKLGWWPDWEVRDREVREEKALLLAYKKWRSSAGPDAAAELRKVCEQFTGPRKRFWSIKKQAHGGPLRGLRSAKRQ